MREGDVSFVNIGKLNRFKRLNTARVLFYPSLRWTSLTVAIGIASDALLNFGSWYFWGVLLPLFVLMLLASLAIALVIVVYRMRMSGSVVMTHGKMCLGCGYDLRHREPGVVVCPECGCVASTRQCVMYWCKLYRSMRGHAKMLMAVS